MTSKKLNEKQILEGKLELLRLKKRNRDVRKHFWNYLQYIYPNYTFKPFHERICNELMAFFEGKVHKIMIFVPPQHGKSTISSIAFPSYAIGKDPNLKVGVTSYSDTLASQFNRATQILMTSEKYRPIFPDSILNPENVSTDARRGALRNSRKFEIINHSGSYTSVGVGGSLTGTPLDIGIIDDPFKDRQTADSKKVRESVWSWYNQVFTTRLDSRKRQIMLFTRWHEDDIAGRLMKDHEEAREWRIISLPAIKEDNIDPNDPRELGEALWPEKHSAESILKFKRKDKRGFAALYQQRPRPLEGTLFESTFFQKITWAEFLKFGKNATWDFYHDGAYTDNTQNDPSATGVSSVINGNLYIRYVESKHMKSSDLPEYIAKLCGDHGYTPRSHVKIEPKASGLTTIQYLKKDTTLNVMAHKFPAKSKISYQQDKVARASATLPYCESGRVYLIEGDWVDSFIDEVMSFPNGEHDDRVDVFTMMCIDAMFPKSAKAKRPNKR